MFWSYLDGFVLALVWSMMPCSLSHHSLPLRLHLQMINWETRERLFYHCHVDGEGNCRFKVCTFCFLSLWLEFLWLFSSYGYFQVSAFLHESILSNILSVCWMHEHLCSFCCLWCMMNTFICYRLTKKQLGCLIFCNVIGHGTGSKLVGW